MTLLGSHCICALNRVQWLWEVLKVGTLSLWTSISLYFVDEEDASVVVLSFWYWGCLEVWVGLSLVFVKICLTLSFWKWEYDMFWEVKVVRRSKRRRWTWCVVQMLVWWWECVFCGGVRRDLFGWVLGVCVYDSVCVSHCRVAKDHLIVNIMSHMMREAISNQCFTSFWSI